NPLRNNFNMDISSDKVKDVNIRISNAVGQKSLERTVSLTKGVNIIVLSSEIANLPAGMYLIDIISDQEKQTRKIFKQ
ncbi:MAG: T9SS type A sorting domain-containing protein, partial [Sphingobacteriales bacterium]|nr:T9SS type A sorting domain-containing protein [Sphingobacteriales bacterium]